MAAAAGQRRGTAASLLALALGLLAAAQVCGDQNQGAVFLREFTLIRRESLHDDFLSDLLNNHKTEDPVDDWIQNIMLLCGFPLFCISMVFDVRISGASGQDRQELLK